MHHRIAYTSTDRSFTTITHSTGTKMDPCVTPTLIGNSEDTFSSTFTISRLTSRTYPLMFNITDVILCTTYNLTNSISCLIEWKYFWGQKKKKHALLNWPSFAILTICKPVSVEWPFLYADWTTVMTAWSERVGPSCRQEAIYVPAVIWCTCQYFAMVGRW